jgi:hypothetical protein
MRSLFPVRIDYTHRLLLIAQKGYSSGPRGLHLYRTYQNPVIIGVLPLTTRREFRSLLAKAANAISADLDP